MTGKFVEAERCITVNVQVSVLELCVRPCELEGSAANVGVTVFRDQAHDFVTRLRRSENKCDLSLLPGLERKPPLDREDGIQDEAGGAFDRQCRVLPGAPPPKEARPVGFIIETPIVAGLSTTNNAAQTG